MLQILVATHNENKKKEIQTLLKGFKGINIMDLADLEVAPPIIVEDGKTFRQNAVKKAVTMSKFFDGLVLADDSGLEVEALDGKPGVRSARFARAKATDQENNDKLLKLLEGTPDNKRDSQFVCTLALAKQGDLLGTFEGIVKGMVIEKPKGKNGFGYDPLFVPKGNGKTFAEMTASDKNKISHRSNALKKFKKDVSKYLK